MSASSLSGFWEEWISLEREEGHLELGDVARLVLGQPLVPSAQGGDREEEQAMGYLGRGWVDREKAAYHQPHSTGDKGDFGGLLSPNPGKREDWPRWARSMAECPCESEKPVVNRIFIGLYHSGQSPPRQPNLNLSGRLRPPRSLPRFLDIVKGSHERQVVEVGRRGASLLGHESSGEDGLEVEEGTGLLDIL